MRLTMKSMPTLTRTLSTKLNDESIANPSVSPWKEVAIFTMEIVNFLPPLSLSSLNLHSLLSQLLSDTHYKVQKKNKKKKLKKKNKTLQLHLNPPDTPLSLSLSSSLSLYLVNTAIDLYLRNSLLSNLHLKYLKSSRIE